MKPENLVHIREIFEEKTGVTLSTARPAVRPLRRAALTVAAVVCCLGVTALAANGLTNGALMQFFQSTDTFNVERTPVDTSAPLSHALEDTATDTAPDAKERVNGVLMQFFQSGGAFGNEGTPEDVATPLSKEQLLTIDRHTTMIGQSQTVNGTTVTLHSVTAAATGHDILTYCTFSVEAPDGTWTEADNETLDFQEYGCLLFEGDAIRYGANGWLRVLDDPQGRPNVKTAVMAFIIHAHGDNSGVQLQVMLNNFRIFERYSENGESKYNTEYITEGSWNFTLPLELPTGISLLDAPITLSSGTMTLQSLELTPLGGSFTITDINRPNVEWQPERVVFSDGSTVAINMDGGILDEEHMLHYNSFTLAAPTDLTNAVAVEFADGTRVEIPHDPSEATQQTQSESPSASQRLDIEQFTTTVNQSQTVGDTTITLQSVTAAAANRDSIVYCVFTVEAPDGAWTETDNESLGFEWSYCELEGTADADGNVQWLEVQDDPQGRPNVKTVIAGFQIINQETSGQKELHVSLENFLIGAEDREEWQYIAMGQWDFTVPLEIPSGLSLVEEPVFLLDGQMKLVSLGLSPLGGSVVAYGDVYYGNQWQPKQVVFADGSIEPLYATSGPTLDGDTLRQWQGFTFAAPTDLTDAIAVEFADGTCIDIP
mgnify:FL=1